MVWVWFLFSPFLQLCCRACPMAQPFPPASSCPAKDHRDDLPGVWREHCILPQTGDLVSSSLLPWPGSAVSVSGDGLADWKTGLWPFPVFLEDGVLVGIWGRGTERSLLSLVWKHCFLKVSFITMTGSSSWARSSYTINNRCSTDRQWTLFRTHLRFSVLFPRCFLDSLSFSELKLVSVLMSFSSFLTHTHPLTPTPGAW